MVNKALKGIWRNVLLFSHGQESAPEVVESEVNRTLRRYPLKKFVARAEMFVSKSARLEDPFGMVAVDVAFSEKSDKKVGERQLMLAVRFCL